MNIKIGEKYIVKLKPTAECLYVKEWVEFLKKEDRIFTILEIYGHTVCVSHPFWDKCKKTGCTVKDYTFKKVHEQLIPDKILDDLFEI